MRLFACLVLLALAAGCGAPQPSPFATSTPRRADPTPTPAAAAATATAAARYQPRFETVECWNAFLGGVSATCGYVAVPEHRGAPFDAENSIRLAVAVLQLPDVRYTQPPTFLLGGGPGQDVVGLFENLLKDYQSIFVDAHLRREPG